MNKYTATVIKTGNSIALRVPKQYAQDAKLSLGEKVELSLPNKIVKQDRAAIGRIIEELQAMNAYSSIKDPVQWQREIRKDRPLPGRS